MQVQLFDQEFADSFDFDVLDPTKIIPEEILPPVAIGRLVLNRMPDNFFAETEQVAFMTQNVPLGIDFSNDPLLQGRTSPISTRSSSVWVGRTLPICQSIRPDVRLRPSSRMATWRCKIP